MTEKTTAALEKLRNEIDTVDQGLLNLLRQRLNLVARVGEVKHNAGLPIYAPQREASMLDKRRDEAEKLGVSPQLIEDILRRLMRESYQNEKNVGFKQVNTDINHVVIVGGRGQLGDLFRQMLSLSGYQVHILDADDWHLADMLFDGVGLVIVTVPISITCNLIRQKLGQLPEDCILADLTSIKLSPMEAMFETHSGPIVGFHPMFGPDVTSLAKQVVVVCHGREQEKYQWLLEQIEIWGAKLVEAEANKHDEAMQVVQALRHFSTFIYGVALFESKADINQLLQFSSPIYRLELAMVGRLFAQNAQLYADIIFAQTENVEQIEGYFENFREGLEMLKSGDRKLFIEKFDLVADWLGDFSAQFQQESRVMLQTAADMKVN
ncbi:bifunctional chorismate mutase/prephenate dehydrogenase [Parashewanella spongiae]|uniref:T-protein n=1 Tax=Parashewanella spongiae TaxID=342950 RepID=A0A3A6TXZ2_9GAMM|nr:bifunctional chorismate mutase/prephenate dehydrogenase [Parashewanella spongiae]MCL1079923.1 bifunctional chorismate mutase/prephenate dehydrogenase [Parashewanella spongiae]RJY06352.1 bifunctional chorismate mutase/prephenate dehydrogenase [Parashewanella spongiae]